MKKNVSSRFPDIIIVIQRCHYERWCGRLRPDTTLFYFIFLIAMYEHHHPYPLLWRPRSALVYSCLRSFRTRPTFVLIVCLDHLIGFLTPSLLPRFYISNCFVLLFFTKIPPPLHLAFHSPPLLLFWEQNRFYEIEVYSYNTPLTHVSS